MEGGLIVFGILGLLVLFILKFLKKNKDSLPDLDFDLGGNKNPFESLGNLFGGGDPRERLVKEEEKNRKWVG